MLLRNSLVLVAFFILASPTLARYKLSGLSEKSKNMSVYTMQATMIKAPVKTCSDGYKLVKMRSGAVCKEIFSVRFFYTIFIFFLGASSAKVLAPSVGSLMCVLGKITHFHNMSTRTQFHHH